MSDDDPRPDDGHGDASRSQPILDVAPAAQMCRECIVVASERPKVDDTPQPGERRAPSEHGGPVCVFPLEIGVAKGVHQVIRRLAGGQGRGQAVSVQDIAVDGRARSFVVDRRAGHGNDLMPRPSQSRAKPTANEAGGPGHEHSHHVTR